MRGRFMCALRTFILAIAMLGVLAQPVQAASDPVARGLAARVLTLPVAVARKKATLVVIGQSTEQGPIPLSDKAAWPNAFVSLRNPGFMQKRAVPVANRGGWWAKVYDDLWDWGYDLDIVNSAIGGVSLLQHIDGFAQTRSNSTIYYQKRAGSTVNFPDRGDFGDIYGIAHPYTGLTRYFNVTTGAKRQVRNSGAFAGVVGTSTYQDFIAFEQGSGMASGASVPAIGARVVGGIASNVLTVSAFTGGKALAIGDSVYGSGGGYAGRITSLGTGTGGTGTYNLADGVNIGAGTNIDSYIPVGGTVQDGTLTITRVEEAFQGANGTFLPGDDGSAPNTNLGGVQGEQNAGRGFDPLSIIDDAWRDAQMANPAEIKIVYFSQGQTDLGGAGALTYQRAVMVLANFWLRRGWTVVLGNTIYSPASQGSTATNYGYQVTGVDDAVTALSAIYPGKVFRGANLYASLGTTGAMGGQRGTGGVTGSTLAISAVQASSGTGFAVGQVCYNGTAVIGTITAAPQSGVGSYTLSGPVTTTAGTAIVCAGLGLQYDGVHQNGSMVAAGGAAIAASLKAFLPKRPVADR